MGRFERNWKLPCTGLHYHGLTYAHFRAKRLNRDGQLRVVVEPVSRNQGGPSLVPGQLVCAWSSQPW
jgi:hypothetical protein